MAAFHVVCQRETGVLTNARLGNFVRSESESDGVVYVGFSHAGRWRALHMAGHVIVLIVKRRVEVRSRV